MQIIKTGWCGFDSGQIEMDIPLSPPLLWMQLTALERMHGTAIWGLRTNGSRKIWEGNRSSKYYQTGDEFPVFLPLVSPGLGSETTWNPELCTAYRQKTSPKEALYFWCEEWEREPLQVRERVEKPCLFLFFPFIPAPAPRQSSDNSGGNGSDSQTGDYNSKGGESFSLTKRTVVPRAWGKFLLLLFFSPLYTVCCFLAQQSRETKTLAFQPEDQGEGGGGRVSWKLESVEEIMGRRD